LTHLAVLLVEKSFALIILIIHVLFDFQFANIVLR
jgi:hypothetical protein